jgi:ankyrin repeat protein
MNILKWIFLANRKLALEELRHAIAIRPDDTTLDRRNFMTTGSLLNCCLGLVVLDEGTSTVRLVHKSLQDYFELEHKSGTLFENGHSEMAFTFLTYLDFVHSHDREYFDSLVASSSQVVPKYLEENYRVVMHFSNEITKHHISLDYSICNWAYHARYTTDDKLGDLPIRLLLDQSKLDVSRNLWSWKILMAHMSKKISLPTKFFDHNDHHFRIFGIYPSEGMSFLQDIISHISALQIAAYYGLDNVVQALIENHAVDKNAEFKPEASPLLLAVISNQESVVRRLSESSGIAIDRESRHLAELILIAAEHGRYGIALQLLDKYYNHKKCRVDIGSPALVRAAWGGNFDVVRLILERSGIDINSQYSFKSSSITKLTALLCAASIGNEEIFRLLLSHAPDKIDVNLKDGGKGYSGPTALRRALDKRHLGIARILLDRDDIDINGEIGTGALTLLILMENCNDVLRLFLEKSKINTISNTYLKNAIYNAIRVWNTDAPRLLLDHCTSYG